MPEPVLCERGAMTLILELPPELERALTEEAARLNLPVHEYALALLADRRPASERPTTGAELVAYWERAAVIGTRPEIEDSQVHARGLREQAERRARP
jgi:hypothetical protein